MKYSKPDICLLLIGADAIMASNDSPSGGNEGGNWEDGKIELPLIPMDEVPLPPARW